MFDWEKQLPKVREKLKQENDERRRFEVEASKRLWPYDFAAGIVLFVALIAAVVAFQSPEPLCGDYTQVSGALRAEGYWVDSAGSPPTTTAVLYQLYKSTSGSEKIAIVDYRAEQTCVVDCVEERCDNYRPWLVIPGQASPLTSAR